MDAVRDQKQTQTLGDWLVGLRPGDACLCCGGELQPLRPVPRPASGRGLRRISASEDEIADSETLVCPRCGCEISTAEWPVFTAERTLDSAA